MHGAALAGKAAEGCRPPRHPEPHPGVLAIGLGQRAPSARDGRHPGDRRGRDGVLAPARAVRPDGRAIRCQAGAGGRSRAAAADRARRRVPGLSERTGFLELEAIRRQRTAWQRQASVALGTRETRAGLEAYREHGAIRFTADEPRRASAWWRITWRPGGPAGGEPDRAGPYPGRRARLNDAIRDRLRAAGELTDEAGFATGAAGRLSFAAGDRLVFLRNDRGLGVKNGSLGTVTDAAEGRLSVALDDGRAVTIAQGVYDAVDHGYATTIHKSQGATVDRSFVLASSGWTVTWPTWR